MNSRRNRSCCSRSVHCSGTLGRVVLTLHTQKHCSKLIEKYLDGRKPWSDQDAFQIELLREKVSMPVNQADPLRQLCLTTCTVQAMERLPFLRRFDGGWPLEAVVKASLDNLVAERERKRARQAMNVRPPSFPLNGSLIRSSNISRYCRKPARLKKPRGMVCGGQTIARTSRKTWVRIQASQNSAHPAHLRLTRTGKSMSTMTNVHLTTAIQTMSSYRTIARDSCPWSTIYESGRPPRVSLPVLNRQQNAQRLILLQQ